MKGATATDLEKFGVDTSELSNGPFSEQKSELVSIIDKFIRYEPLTS